MIDDQQSVLGAQTLSHKAFIQARVVPFGDLGVYDRPGSEALNVVREIYGGEPYEYYPLGRYIVAAPGVCGGRPTFKYTRLEVEFVLDRLAHGESIDALVAAYSASGLTAEAVLEAISLAGQALTRSVRAPQPVG